MTKIISIGHKLNDAKLVSPKECLQDCIDNDLGERGAFKDGNKLVVIGLDDTDDNYHISWTQAGMALSEILSLLEATKITILKDMGY